jgi:hypothetical protein
MTRQARAAASGGEKNSFTIEPGEAVEFSLDAALVRRG